MSAVMSQPVMASLNWVEVCLLEDIVPDTGVCALVSGRQVAIFRLASGDRIFAIDNYDPHSNANVLSRGIVGDYSGEPVVASPVYKQHYSLISGTCLEAPEVSVRVYPARIENKRVYVGVGDA